jgi:hypothetical protein
MENATNIVDDETAADDADMLREIDEEEEIRRMEQLSLQAQRDARREVRFTLFFRSMCMLSSMFVCRVFAAACAAAAELRCACVAQPTLQAQRNARREERDCSCSIMMPSFLMCVQFVGSRH